MAEIFVSYTSSDSQWAQWIATDLRALGHTPHVHEWEIPPGGNILAWMEQHHAAADHVLCVVSEAYLKAPYATLEREAAQWRAATGRADFVLYVVVRPCTLPALIGHFRRCELFDLPEAAARQRFRDFVAALSLGEETTADPAGSTWVVSGDQFTRRRLANVTDQQAAADPLRQQLQRAISDAAAELATSSQRLRNSRTWGRLATTATGFGAIVQGDPLEVPAKLVPPVIDLVVNL